MFEPLSMIRGDEVYALQSDVERVRHHHEPPWSSDGFLRRVMLRLAKRFVCPSCSSCAVRQAGCPR